MFPYTAVLCVVCTLLKIMVFKKVFGRFSVNKRFSAKQKPLKVTCSTVRIVLAIVLLVVQAAG